MTTRQYVVTAELVQAIDGPGFLRQPLIATDRYFDDCDACILPLLVRAGECYYVKVTAPAAWVKKLAHEDHH